MCARIRYQINREKAVSNACRLGLLDKERTRTGSRAVSGPGRRAVQGAGKPATDCDVLAFCL